MSFLEKLYAAIEDSLLTLVEEVGKAVWRLTLVTADILKIVILLSPFTLGAFIGWELIASSHLAFKIAGGVIVVTIIGTTCGVFVQGLFEGPLSTESKRLSERVGCLWVVSGITSIVMIGGIAIHDQGEYQTGGLFIISKLTARLKSQSEASPSVQAPKATRRKVFKPVIIEPIGSCTAFDHMTLWIESVTITGVTTSIALAAHNWDKVSNVHLTEADASSSFITDQNGMKYEFQKDHGDFTWITSARSISPGEIYRWTISYSAINVKAEHLVFKHPECHYGEIQINLKWREELE